MPRSLWLYVFLFLVFIFAVPLSAQPDSSPAGMTCPPICPQMQTQKMEASYENLRLLKLLDAINLTDAQGEKFIPLFHAYRKDLRKLRAERNDLMNQLDNEADSLVRENKIGTLLDRLDENRKAVTAREQLFENDCRRLLTLPQMARMIIFTDRFEREMLESLREFRNRRGPNANSER